MPQSRTPNILFPTRGTALFCAVRRLGNDSVAAGTAAPDNETSASSHLIWQAGWPCALAALWLLFHSPVPLFSALVMSADLATTRPEIRRAGTEHTADYTRSVRGRHSVEGASPNLVQGSGTSQHADLPAAPHTPPSPPSTNLQVSQSAICWSGFSASLLPPYLRCSAHRTVRAGECWGKPGIGAFCCGMV